jgi:gamma-glutamyltranspeptidase/glutathione hydrolase
MLNVLERHDVAAMGPHSPEYLHLFVETKKLVYEDRAKLYADPAFADVPVARLLSREYAAERAALIDQKRARTDYTAGAAAALEKGDTTYLTVADRHGNMVSLIQSNYRGMGCGVVVREHGFILQNRGELFCLEAGHPHCVAPHKRPFHTSIPAFVTRNGKPYMSFGVMGGAMQPQGHVQVLVNLIDFGMDLQAAGDAPRVRHDGSSEPTGESMRDGGVVRLETGFDAGVVAELEKRGHKVEVKNDGGYGGYQAIRREGDAWAGASESRKDGHAAGY